MEHKSEEKDNLDRELYINTPGKVPLHAFRKQFNFHINYEIADINISRLIKDIDIGDVIIDWDVFLPSKKMNLQRGYVWTLRQKQELIFSILKGIKIPPLTVIQLKEAFQKNVPRKVVYRIIDGKQRLSTLISFCKGYFGIPLKGKRVYYNDLSRQAQREIDDCVRINVGYEYPDSLISDEDKIAWFEMINFAGTPQDVEHIQKLKS